MINQHAWWRHEHQWRLNVLSLEYLIRTFRLENRIFLIHTINTRDSSCYYYQFSSEFWCTFKWLVHFNSSDFNKNISYQHSRWFAQANVKMKIYGIFAIKVEETISKWRYTLDIRANKLIYQIRHLNILNSNRKWWISWWKLKQFRPLITNNFNQTFWANTNWFLNTKYESSAKWIIYFLLIIM